MYNRNRRYGCWLVRFQSHRSVVYGDSRVHGFAFLRMTLLHLYIKRAYICTCMCMYMYVCVYIFLCVCLYVCMYACICIYKTLLCLCKHHIHIYTHIHTYIHTYIYIYHNFSCTTITEKLHNTTALAAAQRGLDHNMKYNDMHWYTIMHAYIISGELVYAYLSDTKYHKMR